MAFGTYSSPNYENAAQVIPAVGTPEPNGLTWEEGMALSRAVCATRRVVGFDVVEVAPVPHSTVSEYTLAKLVYKLIGLVAQRDIPAIHGV